MQSTCQFRQDLKEIQKQMFLFLYLEKHPTIFLAYTECECIFVELCEVKTVCLDPECNFT